MSRRRQKKAKWVRIPREEFKTLIQKMSLVWFRHPDVEVAAKALLMKMQEEEIQNGSMP